MQESLMSNLSPEHQSKLIEYRAKAAAGTITLDDMKDAIIILRGSRRAAVDAAAAGRSKAAKAKPSDKSVDEMLGELEGL
jgi:hypothetical protein